MTGPWDAETGRLLSAGGIDALHLNYAVGFGERDLNFLEAWPITRLHILARTLTDIEPIYRLAATLQNLDLTVSPAVMLDCSRLPMLTNLTVDSWDQISGSIGQADVLARSTFGVTRKKICSHCPRTAACSVRLRSAPRLSSLNGVETLTSLEKLAVAGARSLDRLTPLLAVGISLTSLELESCRRLESIHALEATPRLTYLGVNDCGNIDSVSALRSLKHLRILEMWGSTRVIDGDLSPIEDLTVLADLRLANRRHYRPSVAALRALHGLPA